jgi:hypothetical protein
MTAVPHRIHRMIEALIADPDSGLAFAKDPEPFFERFALLPKERQALCDGSPERLQDVGIHPNYQMKLRAMWARAKGGAGPGPLAAWMERLTGETRG